MEMMRALVQQSYRGPEDLVLTSVRRPVAGPGEYLVRVGAAGVNFADVTQSRGRYGGGPQPPYAAGFEAAGEIVSAGSGALPVGTAVIGAGAGAFAEYVVMPAAGALEVPTGWSAAESLGLVLNWATALAALNPLGALEAGETVLIHAAAGGVGQAAVRLAHHYGARVIATAAPAKHDAVRALGADLVLDSTSPDLAAELLNLTGGVDLVLESVGRATFGASLSAARPITGRVVVFGASSGDAALTTHDLIFSHPVQVKGLHIGVLADTAPDIYRWLISELHELVAKGVYPPGRPSMHALADGPSVLRDLEARRTSGKQALDPWR